MLGWDNTKLYAPIESDLNYPRASIPKVSIVIACKNEATHLPHLLESLSKQSFQNFELILMDDHSTDQTADIMKSVPSNLQDVRIIRAKEFGKKKAIKQGVLAAEGELIITTDADCTMGPDWLKTMVSFYCQNPCELIIGPVKIKVEQSLFSKLQSLEFATLVASGAGAAGIKMPILCNAANLAFTKTAWIDCQLDLREDLASGDDIFLLQSIKKRGGKIHFLKSSAAILSTKSANTIKEFINQRQRWASKAPAYTDWMLIFTACIILLINTEILFTCTMAVFHSEIRMLAVTIIGIKYSIDLLFVSKIRNFFSLQHSIVLTVLLTLIYPFYIVGVAAKSVLFQAKWR
jgi:poly-beta-1,6-N-acetyl-D-glucosamine synthase